MSGAAGYYLGAGGGLLAADGAGLLDVKVCVALGSATCPERDDTARGIAAAGLIFGTAALVSTTAIYLVEETSAREPRAFWWPLTAGILAGGATVAATYGLYEAGVDAIGPGLIACFITSVAAEVITMRLLRPDVEELE